MNRDMRKFRAGWRGRLLVRSLIARLSTRATFELVGGYVIVKPPRGVREETVTINILRRRLRVLDTIQVRCFGSEIWLPLLSRLRLRRVVRAVMAEETAVSLTAPPEDTEDVAGRRSEDTQDTEDLVR